MRVYRNAPSKTRKPKAKNPLIEEFSESEEYRYAYAEEHLNTTIALQIRALRDQRKMKQAELAEAIGTKQPGVARLENVNYSRWNIETLKKVARALGVRVKVTFETFGTLLEEDATFSREALERPKFEDDPAFKGEPDEADESLPDLAEVFKILDAKKAKREPRLVLSIQDHLLGKREQEDKERVRPAEPPIDLKEKRHASSGS